MWPVGFYTFEAEHDKTGVTNRLVLQSMRPILEGAVRGNQRLAKKLPWPLPPLLAVIEPATASPVPGIDGSRSGDRKLRSSSRTGFLFPVHFKLLSEEGKWIL